MINIRRGLFETNSSSVHTLVLNTQDYWDYKLDKDKYQKNLDKWGYKSIKVECGNYGRVPQPILYTIKDKADYLWTAIIEQYCKYDWKKRVYKIVNNKKIDWWQKEMLSWLPRESSFVFPSEDPLIGIDHSYALKNFIKELEEKPAYIACLLYDDGSFIDIGGDEYPNFAFAFLTRIEGKIIPMPGGYSFYIKGC